MVIYKRMAGKRQETIPLLAGTGIPLTATGLALLCSSYYVLIGEECNPENEQKVSTAAVLLMAVNYGL